MGQYEGGPPAGLLVADLRIEIQPDNVAPRGTDGASRLPRLPADLRSPFDKSGLVFRHGLGQKLLERRHL
jgi:hypothetical protein